MIANEKQREVTAEQVLNFKDTLCIVDDSIQFQENQLQLYKIMRDGYISQIEELEAELAEYDTRKLTEDAQELGLEY